MWSYRAPGSITRWKNVSLRVVKFFARLFHFMSLSRKVYRQGVLVMMYAFVAIPIHMCVFYLASQ